MAVAGELAQAQRAHERAEDSRPQVSPFLMSPRTAVTALRRRNLEMLDLRYLGPARRQLGLRAAISAIDLPFAGHGQQQYFPACPPPGFYPHT